MPVSPRSRDDFFENRDVHAADLDAHFLGLVEKSGLALDNRGMGRPIACVARHADGVESMQLAAIPSAPGELTLVADRPMDEGSRVFLRRRTPEARGGTVEGIIQHCRTGNRPGDNDHVHVAILKITHGSL